MTIPITFRPIDTWSGKLRTSRKRDRFDKPYRQILDQLDRELGHLGAKEANVLVACRENQLRNDGLLRSAAVLEHPGVVLYVPKCDEGTLRFQTDMYIDWQGNLRAIAEALEGLRTFDRHGIGKGGEQYRGYSALPPAAPIAAGEWASKLDAARWLCAQAKPGIHVHHSVVAQVVTDPAWLNSEYREAAMNAHPDRGGSDELMAKVTRARDFIRQAEGGAA